MCYFAFCFFANIVLLVSASSSRTDALSDDCSSSVSSSGGKLLLQTASRQAPQVSLFNGAEGSHLNEGKVADWVAPSLEERDSKVADWVYQVKSNEWLAKLNWWTIGKTMLAGVVFVFGAVVFASTDCTRSLQQQLCKHEPLLKKIAVFATMPIMGSLINLTQHGAKSLQYSCLHPVLVIATAKLVISVCLYCVYNNPLEDLPKQLQFSIFLKYSIVAAMFCWYDVLSFVNLAIFDPTTYVCFLQLRTVVTGVVWEIAFKKALSWRQLGGLMFMCVGCIIKESGGGFNFEAAFKASFFQYMLLALQILANCLAGVANELLIKQHDSVPLNLQNSLQYSWIIVWCLSVGAMSHTPGIHLDIFDMSEWQKMLDRRMLPSIVMLTFLGLNTSVMLKVLDSVWKAVATSIELFLTSYSAALVFGYAVSMSDNAALVLLAAGVASYSLGAVAPGSQGAKTYLGRNL